MSEMNGKVHPSQDPVLRGKRQLAAVMEALNDATVEEALTVCVNIAGHLCAQMSGGRPSAIRDNANNIAENIKTAAIAKILHDDEKRRTVDGKEEA